MNAGAKFGSAQPLRRREDTRFLTGAGRYVDDLAPAGALHAVFLRSTVAHGVITGLDLGPARDVPGVHLVLGADDLAATGIILGMKGARVKNRDGSRGATTERPVLARGRVRYAGEPIAVVIADTVEAARDAAELIGVEIDDLPVALGLALGEGLCSAFMLLALSRRCRANTSLSAQCPQHWAGSGRCVGGRSTTGPPSRCWQ